MSSYLTTLTTKVPQHADAINEMKDLFQKKLWHQLTETIQAFISSDEVKASVPLVDFYNGVISDFASRANQLSLASMVVTVANTIPSLEERLNFLEKVLSAKYVSDNKEATVVLASQSALVEVEAGKLDEATKRLEKSEEMLETMWSAEAEVHAAYFKARCALTKQKSDAQAFYRYALQYVSYKQLEEIPEDERRHLAFDLALASLRAVDVYNFGEVIEKGVLGALAGTPHEWLDKVIVALNEGNIREWQNLEKKYKQELTQHLNDAAALIQQKAAILSVIELIFHRDATDRIVPFADIAHAAFIETNRVELLIMKALALKLIKGRIDQTTQTFAVSWVQPRVLGQDQIKLMKDRLSHWTTTVQDSLTLVESQISPEILS